MYTVANNSPEEVRPKTEPILRGYRRRQRQRVCSEFYILVSCCIPPCTTAAKEKSCKAKNKKLYLYYTGGENIFTKSRLRKPYICQEVPARAKKGRREFLTAIHVTVQDPGKITHVCDFKKANSKCRVQQELDNLD